MDNWPRVRPPPDGHEWHELWAATTSTLVADIGGGKSWTHVTLMGKYNSHADAQFACSEFTRNLAGPIRHSGFC